MPSFVRDGVDQPLAHERRFVAAGRTISGRRRLVGQAEVADRAIGRNAIGPGRMPAVMCTTRAAWVRT